MTISELRKIGHAFALALTFPALLLTAASAFAQCAPTTSAAAPLSNATVICTGTVTNQNSPNGYGTGAENNLTINVQANATVTGTTSPGNGISVANGNTINNLGAITGPQNNGIIAFDNATDTLTVNNNSASATISGLVGVNALNGGVAVVNLGTITANGGAGSLAIVATANISVTNMQGGLISTTGNDAIDNGAANTTVTVTNSGTITAATASIHSFGTLSLTNNATGVLNGGAAGQGGLSGSNAGIINGGIGSASGDVSFSNTGNITSAAANTNGVETSVGNIQILSNSGTISGDVGGIAAGAFPNLHDVTVTNTSTGKIMATGASGNQAVGILANTATIDNFGLISTGGANASSIGIATFGLTTLTNELGGTISSSSGSAVQVNNATIMNAGIITGTQGVVLFSPTATVSITNSGTIIGTTSFAINADLQAADVTVTNSATGKIMAMGGASGNQAIGILARNATINNSGLISASSASAINDGINTTGPTTLNNMAGATISSSSRSGVRVNNATIMNAGVITGNEGIVFRNADATGTVFNSGTITGTSGVAIDFGLNGSTLPFTLTLAPGSVINGKVMSTVATTGLDTFQLGGSGNGTFDGTLGPGQQYDGFSVFNKIGSSTWTVTGANAFAGPTNVEQGALIVTGSLGNSNVTVAGGATLGGSGTVGGLVVQSGATIAPGMPTPFSTLNVSGNASFAANSTFVVNINGQGQNDKIAVGGTAALSGGTVQVIAGTGITPASRYTILTAQGGVQGAFAQLATTSNLAFLSPSLSEDAHDVFLNFVVPLTLAGSPVTFQSAATTRNEIATATALQALGSGPVFNAVIGQSAAGARQAFDALSGEIHASTVTAAFEDALLPQSAILGRLNQPATPPVLGASTGTTASYAADLPRGKKPGLAPVEVRLYQPRVFDAWGQGFGDWGHIKSDGNAASLSRSTGGFVLGADVSASNFMGGDWRFGVAGGYTHDQIRVSQRQSSSTFESVFGGVYVGASFGAVQLRAGALYATNTTSTTRAVIFPGFSESLASNNGGSTAQAFGEAGYRIELSGLNLAGLGLSRIQIEPFAGAAAILIHQNGFTEAGGVAALTGLARDFDVETTTFGLRGELAFASLPLTLKTMLGWRHAFGNVIPSTLLAFQGAAQAFSIAGIPIDRDAFVAEAGLDYAVTSSVRVGISSSAQIGGRASDYAFKGHIDVSF